MVSMAAFNKTASPQPVMPTAVGPIPASIPPPSAPPAALAPVAQLPPGKPKPVGMAALASQQADKEGMKPDDPLRIILVSFGEKLDKFEKLLANHGPDAGQRAAESATTVMRENAARLSNQIKKTTLALIFAGFGVVLAGGATFGWLLRGATAVEVAGLSDTAFPRGMAEQMTYQNWSAQWDARRRLPGGWVLVPFRETPPSLPKN